MIRISALLVALVALVSASAATAVTQSDADRMAAALRAVRGGEWSRAASIAPPGHVIADMVEWHRLRSGRGSFDDALAFLTRRPDWPGLPLLREKAEETLPVGERAAEVIAFFGDAPPQTGRGVVALTSAFEATGARGDAEATAVLAWLDMSLSAPAESDLLARYGPLLADHHVSRLDMLLWRGLTAEARRMLPRVDPATRTLAEARLALQADAPGVDGLIAKVHPALLGDPGLAHDRMAWRLRRGRHGEAAALMLEHSPGRLGLAEAWADERERLARAALDDGDPRLAYRLAAENGLHEGSSFADLEWLAGFVALTRLDDPATAIEHFRRFRTAVATPISLGRAGYWEGRAAEALGDEKAAADAYAFGAEHQSSFYGQLAAEKLGLPLDPALTGRESYPDWTGQAFSSSSVLEAALLLQKAEERNLASRFMVHLAESLGETEMGSLADLALSLGEPHIALMIAKHAATRGIVLPRAYFPVVEMGVSQPGVPVELQLAVARRESEFHPGVQSHAGARGLMQLMPGTAQDVSRELGLGYSAGRLLTDPVYNATLGSAYLAGLVEQFGSSAILVAAGYNAGPGRPRSWIRELGDPRRAGTDIVDWIERIPFAETRNYVMRVSEALAPYRARLTGEAGAVGLTAALAGR